MVAVSAYMGGTRGSVVLFSASDVLEMSVVVVVVVCYDQVCLHVSQVFRCRRDS